MALTVTSVLEVVGSSIVFKDDERHDCEPSRVGGVKLTHHLTLQLPQGCNNSQ